MSDLVSRFVRVLVSGIWGWLAVLLLNWLGITFSEEQSAMIIAALTVVFAAVINALIGLVAKKLPWVENLLVVGSSPSYKKITG